MMMLVISGLILQIVCDFSNMSLRLYYTFVFAL